MATTIRTISPVTYYKAKSVILWAIQFASAAFFVMVGANKLAGNEKMIQMFDLIGFGQWFRYFTGSIEVVSAFMLVLPILAGLGALLLACTMAGAVLTHLFLIGGSPGLPIVLFALMALVAYGRRESLKSLFAKDTNNGTITS